MPGYKLCSSDYNSIGQNYLCNFCGFLLRDAMQTGCGHLLQAYSLRKSRAVSWSLFAGRIGVAYLEYWTGSIAAGFSSSSRSCSIFSLRAHGTGLALWKTELALWSTWVLAFTPSIRSWDPPQKRWVSFWTIPSKRLSRDESSLILGQFSLIIPSQSLPNRDGPSPET